MEKVEKNKKPYTAPELVVYGDVKSLVQTGSGGTAENVPPGGGNECTSDKNRFSCV